MSTAELTTIALKLGLKADQMELTMDVDPASVPDGQMEQYREHFRLLRAADVAISTLLEQRENIKRTLYSTQRELEFKSTMINDIINKNYG